MKISQAPRAAVIARGSHATIGRSHPQRHHAPRNLVSVATAQQFRCLDKNWRQGSEGVSVQPILLTASWPAVRFGHFSALGSRYKRKSVSLKIARLWRLRHVLLRSSDHHLDTQISHTLLASVRRILDRD